MGSSYRLHEQSTNLPSLLSDEEVVARVKAGETGLYEILMRRYNQRLFRIIRSMVADDDEAEDIMQHAYVQAFSSLHQFAGKAQFSTWLARIAVYEAYRRTRKGKLVRPITSCRTQDNDMDAVMSPDPDPEKQALSREAVSILEQAIDALPRIYRSVFMLREIEALSTAETAACLDITAENVKVRLLRARQLLRAELYARVGANSSRAFQFMGDRCDRVVRNVLATLGQHN
ncbi:MAG: RNA polymerase sigma factor [Bryobacteraceae bacterium]